MIKFGNAFRTSAAILAALLIAVPPSAAQVVKKQPAKQMLKRPAVDKKLHHLVLQVKPASRRRSIRRVGVEQGGRELDQTGLRLNRRCLRE